MVKKTLPVLARTLEVGGLVQMRSNHLDSQIISIATFLPFNVQYGEGKIEFEKSMDLPLFIFTDGNIIQFEFIEEPDQVVMLKGQKYRMMGYPQPTHTMFSLEAFKKIFGKNPQKNMPKPISKLPKVNPEQLLLRIEKVLRKYVGFFDVRGRLDHDLYKLVSYWILLSYVYDVWPKASYLKIMGIHGSGKSTFSVILELLSFCSERSTGKITESPFYRGQHNLGGVQCLDELELTHDNYSQFLSILKSGHTKGSFVKLSNRNDPNKIEHFNVFSPKTIAGTDVQNIDPILSSRMIDITMRPAAEEGYNFAEEDLWEESVKEETRKLRDDLYIFRLTHGFEFLARKREDKEATFFSHGTMKKLKNRAYDVFAPILIASRLHGGKLMVDALVRTIDLQLEIKKREFYEDFDLPVIRIIIEATRTVDKSWLSAREISDTIINLYSKAEEHARRAILTKKYDTEIIIKRLKGLGLHRDEKTDLIGGRMYLFVKVDIDKFAKKRGIDLYTERNQHKDILLIREIMKELQFEQDEYATQGIPFDVIKSKVGFDPSLYLLNLAQGRKPMVMKKDRNRWILVYTD